MNTLTPISIYLNRPSNAGTWDKVIIRMKEGEENVEVSYYDGYSKTAQPLILYRASLVQYIITLMRLVREDREPFETVQFNFPGLPSILYNVDDLHSSSVCFAIRSAARMTSDMWFGHLLENESGDSSSDESSCCGDY